MYVKVKELMFFCYGETNKCYVKLWPQQKWELTGQKGGLYTISRKNLVMEISKDDFEKYFEVVERSKNLVS